MILPDSEAIFFYDENEQLYAVTMTEAEVVLVQDMVRELRGGELGAKKISDSVHLLRVRHMSDADVALLHSRFGRM